MRTEIELNAEFLQREILSIASICEATNKEKTKKYPGLLNK